jgi:hypothetical protein
MIIIGTPHTKGAGYYKNDDTASGGKKSEADIRTCTHCQAVIKMQAWKEDGGFCGKCMGPDLFVLRRQNADTWLRAFHAAD